MRWFFFCVFIYTQTLYATNVYYQKHRCSEADREVLAITSKCGADAFAVSLVWPIYWNYRLWDKIIGG